MLENLKLLIKAVWHLGPVKGYTYWRVQIALRDNPEVLPSLISDLRREVYRLAENHPGIAAAIMKAVDRMESVQVLQNAIKLAHHYHRGQLRRDGVTPYITHPAAVARFLADAPLHIQAAAWLHDVLEDTEATSETLEEAGIPQHVIRLVELLTHDGEPYDHYIRRAANDPEARMIKLVDIMLNASDKPTDKQKEKYARVIEIFLRP